MDWKICLHLVFVRLARPFCVAPSVFRKKRAMPEDLATAEAISAWEATANHTLHKTNPAGVTCLDLHPTRPNLVCSRGLNGAHVSSVYLWPCCHWLTVFRRKFLV